MCGSRSDDPSMHDERRSIVVETTAESVPVLSTEEGDIFPQGFGCPSCDGTGFVSQETLDRLRAEGYNVPHSAYPAGTPSIDPDSPLGRDPAVIAALDEEAHRG